ncbi:MAG: DUF4364 family protein [Lachnospiraceae bacterium]
MENDSLTLYKLIILSMLDLVDFPLSNSQLSEFIIEQEYTDYFHVQQATNELLDSGLIVPEMIRNTTYYQMTDAGRETLDLFGYKISRSIEEDIFSYLEKKRYQLKNHFDITAEYYSPVSGQYVVDCVIKERNKVLLNMSLSVPSEQQAVDICDQWQERSSDVYAAIMQNITRNTEEE